MLRIVGDINLTDGYFDVGFGVGRKIEEGYDPFQKISRNSGDLWIGNFEGVAADCTNKIGIASRQFRIEPRFLNNVKHFDIYGYANNHAMQHGENAYNQCTEVLLGLGSIVVGGAKNHSAVFEHQNRKIAMVVFSQRIDSFSDDPCYWHNPEYCEIEEGYGNLPKDAFKIVYIHWGNEFINYPSSQQKKFAHWLIDIGFDLIVGMHPHILQGYEVYKGKYIFYSIGNFVFDMAWAPTHYGAIVDVDFSKQEPMIEYEYVRIGDDYFPYIIEEDNVPVDYRFGTLNKHLSKEENTEEYHTAIYYYYRLYRTANRRDILKKMLKHPLGIFPIIIDFIKRKL